eukprot:scaffold92435_cov22-Prasinocladus_malaysianus.AAC.1
MHVNVSQANDCLPYIAHWIDALHLAVCPRERPTIRTKKEVSHCIQCSVDKLRNTVAKGLLAIANHHVARNLAYQYFARTSQLVTSDMVVCKRQLRRGNLTASPMIYRPFLTGLLLI